MSECSLHPSDRFYNVSAIRKTLFSLSEFRERTRVVLLVIPASKVHLGKVWIERECVIEGIFGRRQPRRAWLESFSDTLDPRDREICPRQRKIRIQLSCLLVQANCTFDIALRVKTPANGNCPRAQIRIVSGRIVRGLGLYSRFLLRTERRAHGVGNVCRQFALQRKRVRQSTITILPPKVPVGTRID